MNIRNTYHIFGLILLLIMGSCSHTRYVTMNAVRPAEITFPEEVRKILLVNRTAHENRNLNILEGVLTGERPGDDRRGVQETMLAFSSQLTQTPRFEVMQNPAPLTGNSMGRSFPEPLPWDSINYFCDEYSADIVVAIEVFDSDFVITSGQRTIRKIIEIAGSSKQVPITEFIITGKGNVTVGFRIYDPVARTIVDQDMFRQDHQWESSGINPLAARASLINRPEAIMHVARLAGTHYAYKIAPLPIRIRREFYSRSRKVPEMAMGSRQADVNEWNKSVESWKKGLEYAKRKDAGRLSYDIAIAYEVLGDLELAVEWVQRSYVDYDNKKARDYYRLLRNRIRDEAIIEEQLK
ncbi:MAG: DUF6340 family protein [Cyclobacteriaceae bacterium]|nr:DUF6340 family protein [Cyclobacteriaceae bacterium]